ncbi:MAG: alpha-xylosidase [Christensenellales bacterium]|jgi:alpha-D-xyloside xylohydrolase
MKFNLGHWVVKPNMVPLYAHELYRHSMRGNRLEMLVPTRHVAGRGDMQIAALSVTLSSPMEGVIGVTLTHHKGRPDKPPFFALQKEDAPVTLRETEDALEYSSGCATARISKKPNAWRIDFLQNGRSMTSTNFRAMAHFTDRETGKTYVRDELELDVGECVYGLGERFTPFVKNGQVVEIWNGDGGSCSELAYKNIPLYLTNRGYGVFVDTPADVAFEVGSENVERVQFSVAGETLTYYVIAGDTPREVLRRYTSLTGKPALPPAWSFGLWLSTSFTTQYDEKTVTSFIQGMTDRDIPLSVFHFDCFWMKGFRWCDFRWDEDVTPDARAMLSRYKARGLHICLWLNPYIAQDSHLFEEGMEKGYLVKRTDGSVWQTDLWQSGMGLVDFTNPDATKWYQDALRPLLEDGADCFKTDFGERIPVRDIAWHDGSDPVRMHNYYTHLYNRAVFSLLEEVRGKGEAIVFARSATAGGQTMPVHWGGDNSATYVSMAETLRAGLSLSMCGFGFWSHDISGFESTAPADVYKRWCAFGLLSSHSRLHGSSSYRVPWLFDEEACDVLRFFVKLKHRLMPYLYEMARIAHAEGIPMLRPMIMEFPNDPACDALDRQYMLGESLLVAPVFSKSGRVEYYLPRGTWTNLLDGRVRKGGTWTEDTCDFFQIPLWVRENTVLCTGKTEDRPDYDYADNPTISVYALSEGAEKTVHIPDVLGNIAATVTARKENGEVKLTAQGLTKYDLIV